MKLYQCALCHDSFRSAVSDTDAASEFETHHHADFASTPVVVVCTPCYRLTIASRREQPTVPAVAAETPRIVLH